MASAGVAPSGYKNSSGTSMGVEKLPDQMNELKIRDDKVQILGPLILGLLHFVLYLKQMRISYNVFLCGNCRKLKQPLSMAKGQKLGT